jgi:hypothetical protein
MYINQRMNRAQTTVSGTQNSGLLKTSDRVYFSSAKLSPLLVHETWRAKVAELMFAGEIF